MLPNLACWTTLLSAARFKLSSLPSQVDSSVGSLYHRDSPGGSADTFSKTQVCSVSGWLLPV